MTKKEFSHVEPNDKDSVKKIIEEYEEEIGGPRGESTNLYLENMPGDFYHSKGAGGANRHGVGSLIQSLLSYATTRNYEKRIEEANSTERKPGKKVDMIKGRPLRKE